MNLALDSYEQSLPEAAVYDPSCRRAETGSYWQWSNVKLDTRWNRIAECINQGWPAESAISDQSSRWYGTFRTSSGECWIYRLYAGGRDRFGRDGRYFFALVRLQSKDVAAYARVAGLFDYFDGERSLPLKTKNLSEGWSDAVPDQLLKAIYEILDGCQEVGHWGIGDSGEMIRFLNEDPLGEVDCATPLKMKAEGEPPSMQPTRPKAAPPLAERRKNKKFMIVFAAAAIALILLIKPFHRQQKPVVEPPEKRPGNSPETIATQVEVTEGSNSETPLEDSSQAVEDQKSHTDHAPKPTEDNQYEPQDEAAPIKDDKPDPSESAEEESTEQDHPINHPEQPRP